MAYKGITFRKELHIDQIFSLHYFEYMSTFSFPGKRIISGNLSV